MNQQQAHQVRTMNVATTAAAHNRVTQHDKDKAKMFVNQQEYDQVKDFLFFHSKFLASTKPPIF